MVEWTWTSGIASRVKVRFGSERVTSRVSPSLGEYVGRNKENVGSKAAIKRRRR